jgi:hypothetical protein
MARWTEDREREQARGRYGEDERRWRGEEGWRGRDWREDERGTEWRGGERGELGGAHGWRGGEGRWGGGEGRWGGGERGFDERESGFTREMRRQAGEEEPGAFERMGERMKEGWRSLTGRGPKGYKRSDERIRDDLSERIARSWVDAVEVEVKVEKGEVTLTGFVRSREEKRTIEDLADDVFGVDDVNNHLKVRREERTQSQALTAGSGQGTVVHGAAASAGQSTQPGQRAQQTTGQQPGQPQQPGARH